MSSDADYGAAQFRPEDGAPPAPETRAAPQDPAAPQAQGSAQYYDAPQSPAAPQYPGAPQAQGSVQYYGAPQFQGAPQQVVLPKNPALGVILSFFIPGLGSIVNGSTSRGVIILIVYVVGWILAFFIIGIPVLIGAWIWGLVDGYLSAQRWNQAHGIVS